jgi:hypothetical protein
MKMTVFWDIVPYSLVEVYRRWEVLAASIIRATRAVSHVILELLIAVMMEAVSTSETSLNFYRTTRCNIREDSHHSVLWEPEILLNFWMFLCKMQNESDN